MPAMNSQQLIRGLVDIANENIPVSCIYDMIPEIIEHLKASENNLIDQEQSNEYRTEV